MSPQERIEMERASHALLVAMQQHENAKADRDALIERRLRAGMYLAGVLASAGALVCFLQGQNLTGFLTLAVVLTVALVDLITR